MTTTVTEQLTIETVREVVRWATHDARVALRKTAMPIPEVITLKEAGFTHAQSPGWAVRLTDREGGDGRYAGHALIIPHPEDLVWTIIGRECGDCTLGQGTLDLLRDDLTFWLKELYR